MISRMLNAARSLFVYFCLATLLAQAVILGYLWFTWKLDREKLILILAVAQGIDLSTAQQPGEGGLDEVSPEQVSFQEILDHRAAMARDLELRELALKDELDQMRLQQKQLAESQQKHKQLTGAFQARVLALKEGAEARGRETVRLTLESIKPKQAKEQLVQMLEDGKTDEVVLLLAEMSESKRAKILGEFKTPEENQELGDVLRLIGQGEPESSIAEESQQQL